MEPLIAEPVLLAKPTFENITLHRIQLRLTTAGQSGSNNDQGVYVQLHAADDKFYMNRAMDNYEANHTDMYDILSRNIKAIKDIQFIKLGVKGGDDWRIRKMELLLNDCATPIFVKDYGTAGLNITSNQPLTISGQVLRQYAGWSYNNSNQQLYLLPAVLPKAKLLSLVEAAIGNQIQHTADVAWGTDGQYYDTRWGAAVEVSYKNHNTLTFDLDLQKTMDGPNPEVDVNFDLEFRCVNGHIQFDVKNISYGTNWVGQIMKWLQEHLPTILAIALKDPISSSVVSGYLSKFLDYSVIFDPQAPVQQQACRLILVQPNCDIRLR